MKNLKLFIFQVLLLASTVTLILTDHPVWALIMFVSMVGINEKE